MLEISKTRQIWCPTLIIMYLSLKPFSCQVNFAYFKETKRKTKRKKDKEDEDSDMEEDDEEDPFR